jgi:hypothetical protein
MYENILPIWKIDLMHGSYYTYWVLHMRKIDLTINDLMIA